MLPTFLPVVPLLLAAVLLWFGWFGRKLRIPPECARCRFPIAGIEQHQTCPECGASILSTASRRVERRTRRPKVLIAGIITLTIGLAFAEGLRRRFNWLQLAPVSFLESRATRGDSFDPSIEELRRRAEDGNAESDVLGRVVRSLLATEQWERPQNFSVHFDPYLNPEDRAFLRSWAHERNEQSLPLGSMLRTLLSDEACLGASRPEDLEAYLRASIRPGPTMLRLRIAPVEPAVEPFDLTYPAVIPTRR